MARPTKTPGWIPLSFFLFWFVALIDPSTCSASSGSISAPTTTRSEPEGIPRSANYHNSQQHSASSEYTSERSSSSYPPWNPSREICGRGFLKSLYTRIPGVWEQDVRLRTSVTLTDPCQIRQVPGDGNCLFHSISVGLGHAVNGTHIDMKRDLPFVYKQSRLLRQQAVECLQDSKRRLCLQGNEWVKSRELVQAAAQQYGLTAEQYCQDMQQESVWGGGPEIVALSNVLKRPIHVYELTASKPDGQSSGGGQQQQFVLRRMACFGSPRYDKFQALHILSADSRFPDITPGSQLSEGNHFLAVFPVTNRDGDDDDLKQRRRRKRKKRLRGGSFFTLRKQQRSESLDTSEEDDDCDDDKMEQQREEVNTGPGENTHKDEDSLAAPQPRWMGGWWRRTNLL